MPEEIQQEVNEAEETSTPAEEVATEEVVEEVADDSQQEEAQPEPTQTVPDSKQDLYDENGVPWKNRAMEYRRKTEDLVEKLPTLLEEAINKKTGEPKLDWIGYGYLFENAIEKIIRIEAGANKDVTTLREYVTEYHRLLSETQSLINKADISKQKKVS